MPPLFLDMSDTSLHCCLQSWHSNNRKGEAKRWNIPVFWDMTQSQGMLMRMKNIRLTFIKTYILT